MLSRKNADTVPTRDQLDGDAMRHVAGGALVVLAAAIVHRAGHTDQQWQYVAIAAALLPQVLLDLLAAGDPRRRERLRTSRRPSTLPLVAAGVLAVTAPMALLLGEALTSVLAALSAGAGLAVAAAPVTVKIAPRRRR